MTYPVAPVLPCTAPRTTRSPGFSGVSFWCAHTDKKDPWSITVTIPASVDTPPKFPPTRYQRASQVVRGRFLAQSDHRTVPSPTAWIAVPTGVP